MLPYALVDLEEFIEHCCSTGAVPSNNILVRKEELKAERLACKSDKAMEKYIRRCVKGIKR